MRRAYAAGIFLTIFSLAFLPGKVAGFTSPCSQSNNLVPPFIASGVKPNILILLDVSQSMDEDFYGQAVGSYAPTSKSVVARQALQNMVAQLKQKANVGVMTFTLNTDVSQGDPNFLYNEMPFTSYQISSYCPSPTAATLAACQNYCVTGDPTSQAECQSGCSLGNISFSTNFTDPILNQNGLYPFNEPTGIRAGYCAVAYPKIYSWQDPGGGPTVYHNASDALYIGPSGQQGPGWGTASEYGYCDNYSTAQNAPNSYNFYGTKSNQSDGPDNNGNPGGYSNKFTSAQFQPTDSDWALGFYNFGVRLPFYYVGPTIFSGTSPNSSQGFLHVAIGDLTSSAQFAVGVTNADQYDNVYDVLIPNCDDGTNCNSGTDGTPYAGTPSEYPNYITPYMQCSPSNSDYNTCPYLVNAGNTPTAGALQSALSYFNGNYTYSGSSVPTPITQPCQQNFIILVTDGLPDTTLNGEVGVSGSTNYTLMAQQQTLAVLQELDGQSQPASLPPEMSSWQNVTMKQNGTTYNFNVKTYVLGLGLTTLAKTNLDAMATAGGTAADNSGHAYYANSPAELTAALQSITGSLFSGVSAGSSVSVLASQAENGANVLQGIFYTTKTFGSGNNSITWPGYLYDWWFYNGPVYQNIREDTLHDFILELGSDDVLNFTFGMTNGMQVQRDTPETNGSAGPTLSTVGLDSLTPIWEAGKMLWAESPASRTIYTPSQDGSSLVSFNISNSTLTTPGTSPLGYPSNLDPCLTGNATSTSLDNLINYVVGNDFSTNLCKSSTGSIEYICSDGNGNYGTTPCTADSDCANTSDPYCMPVTCTTSSDCSNSSYPTCSPDSCRNRTVNLCVQDASSIATAGSVNISGQGCSTDSDCTAPYSTCSPSTPPNTWKLGDIVYSTPKVVASFSYCSTTSGTSFQSPTRACTTDADCTNSSYPLCTQKESVVFVGANDGMLHAFKTGVLSTAGLDGAKYQVDKLIGIPTSDMGSELWGFVPRNVLPYLRCLAVPPPNSCHLYYNDLSPYITTMYVDSTGQVCANVDGNGNVISYTDNPCTSSSSCSSGQLCKSTTLSTPHTVLIGGLRLGGGAQTDSQGNYCFNSTGISNGASCTNVSKCQTPFNASCAPAFPTNAPTDTCGGGVAATIATGSAYTPSPCIGLSSYYALDITDVENPKLLWEFSDPQLGYSYSGPAVIHKWTSSTTPLTGDQYDVMFLSGPTDPQDGSSIQNLRAFILKLDPATLAIDSIYQTDFKNNKGNSIANAFGGRLFTTGLDVDSDGYTDYVFFGYSASPNGTSNWSGGIGFVYTDAYTTSNKTSSIDPVNGVDPSKWTFDVKTYDNIPQVPITAQIGIEPCWYNFDGSPLTYLFAGTGRYFFPMDNYGSSGNSGLNFIMGVPFTCNDVYQNCGSPNINSLNQNNDACSALASATSAKDLTQAGWLIDLSGPTTVAGESYGSERMITDPTTSPVGANGGNVIFFTTTEPTNNPCGYGGQTFLYGLNCATGSSIASQDCSNYVAPGTGGSIYIQTSTGAINAISTSTSFTQNSGRETAAMAGIAPEGGAVFLPPGSTGGKTGQIIQWIEK
ncbi:MAG: hypothetical protein ACP5IL_03430 [Syntrophobacteraceae bacterium]